MQRDARHVCQQLNKNGDRDNKPDHLSTIRRNMAKVELAVIVLFGLAAPLLFGMLLVLVRG